MTSNVRLDVPLPPTSVLRCSLFLAQGIVVLLTVVSLNTSGELPLLSDSLCLFDYRLMLSTARTGGTTVLAQPASSSSSEQTLDIRSSQA